ncbi:MAG: PilZ domain-containing protein [Pyrinomonadaceae bacterium]
MQCPRCKSERVQRDYDEAFMLARIIGMHKLLCNNCSLVFSGFDPLGRLRRGPPEKETYIRNRRRTPRYRVHLPTAISLIEGKPQAGKVSYSEPSRGHCETLSTTGMGLSLVGARFSEEELTRIGRLLFIRVNLPEGAIEAVVSVVQVARSEADSKRKWVLGVSTKQISEADQKRLTEYLDKRAQEVPAVVSDL